ncbi:MAG: DUF4337 domain-containing protein [Chthonomonadaceae bacterium]|nr:DUF4337 domain-containing protein [Chthonomonadaceae bacterium]
MPEEIEIETEKLQESIDEMREERVERVRQEKETAWTRWISLSTALLAVVAAIGALQSGSLVNEALITKNNALLKQSQASDQWAYYQAKGLKSNGAKQTVAILASLTNKTESTENTEKWKAEAERYNEEQKEIEKKAHELEKERDEAGKETEHLMHRHHIFAYCVTLTQVAIALSAIAALTKRKPIWFVSLLLGALGLYVFITGFLSAHG